MIYLVEDDDSIRELVVYMLCSSGWETAGFGCCADFWAEMKSNTPELILLDIMLPDEDGLSVLKKLRASDVTAKIPVILLTAKGSEYDKVVGLDSGADDYITKPFGMMELVSRIKALLRRTVAAPAEAGIQIGSLRLLVKKHQVLVQDQLVVLTHKEFELLYYLMKNKGIVLNREQLLSNIWGYDFEGETRTLDVHIRTLRQKLGSAGELIETVRGVGYKVGD